VAGSTGRSYINREKFSAISTIRKRFVHILICSGSTMDQNASIPDTIRYDKESTDKKIEVIICTKYVFLNITVYVV